MSLLPLFYLRIEDRSDVRDLKYRVRFPLPATNESSTRGGDGKKGKAIIPGVGLVHFFRPSRQDAMMWIALSLSAVLDNLAIFTLAQYTQGQASLLGDKNRQLS